VWHINGTAMPSVDMLYGVAWLPRPAGELFHQDITLDYEH